MSLDELFNKKPIILPGTASQRLRRQAQKVPVEPANDKPYERGCDYAVTYMKEEENLYRSKPDDPQSAKDEHGTLSEVDSLSNLTSLMTTNLDDKEDIFQRYPLKRRKHNENLTIFEEKDKILKRINTHKVVIIKGATGCGKTTQVPQFILNAARDVKQYCKIVVTQPRRIAAISVAKRVADEMNVRIGTLVGYQVGLDREVCEDTRLLFCTTGVLLQKLINQKHMKEFTHIILDEIHERNQDMDFLLLVARKLLNTNSREVKVILMSATIDTAIFTEYFFTMTNGEKMFPVVVDISENRKYNLITSFLDGLKNRIPEAHGIELDLENPEIGRKSYLTAVRLIQFFDSIDDAENKTRRRENNSRGSVLVFLPGLHEIEEMETTLRSKEKEIYNNQQKKYQWKIIPLHSSITHDEQRSVFLPVETGYRKIILSTNIAESSITVEDIDYVIDFCLTKTMVTDQQTNFCHLKLEWASKNSLDQRAGRVGRVSDGRVFRLITEDFYQNLDQETTPEMLRCPLDRLVLQAKLLDMGEPRAIFGIALSSPYLENIEHTILTLKEVGALSVQANKKYTQFDGDITRMGLVIARLPLDVRSAKLIFIGNLFGVLEECIVMACALSVKNLFCQPFRDYLKSYNMKLSWADSSCSDCIAFCNAYKLWRKKSTEGFGKNRENQFRWAKDHFVELKTLKEIALLQREIEHRLKYCGIKPHTEGQYWKDKPKKALFIKLAIAAAFYPHYFFRGSQGGQVDEKDAVITLGGHDPFSTVYLQGVPHNQPSILYKESIKEKFSECSNRVNVFVDNSSKVFVQFGRSEEVSFDERYRMHIPGKISLAVYRAVKMRQQPEFKFKIPVLNPMDASIRYQDYLERCETMSMHGRTAQSPEVRIAWPWNKNTENFNELIEINISHVESPNHFWVQSRYPNEVKVLFDIVNALNEKDALEPLSFPLKAGRLCAALFVDDDGIAKFYRCRILSVNDFNKCDIYFVDYGNTKRNCDLKFLRDFGRQLLLKKIDVIPDLAVECSLAKIRPRSTPDGNGEWMPKAISVIKSCENHVYDELAIKVYSFVNNIANVKLRAPRHSKNDYLNKLLIEMNLAEECEESYLSIIDHEERKRRKKLVNDGDVALHEDRSREKLSLISKSDFMEEDLQPKLNECSQEVVLRGPFSPLEMRIYGATKCSVGKLIRIESTSVNSVLLDTNPSDSYERMVVASSITTNDSGDKLTLRGTTVMPNIPGLPALMCLMFAPMVELRCNSSCTKLSGALCGLGYDPDTRKSLFPENDIELLFDVEFVLEDIALINKIRFWLNKAVDPAGGFDEDIDVKEWAKCRSHLIGLISNLFEKRFELQELNFFMDSYQWCRIPQDSLVCPCADSQVNLKSPDDFSFVYRLIWGIYLDGDSSIETCTVAKNIRQLREFALGQMNIGVKSMECILCRITLSNAINAKLHLKSSQHKIRQRRFKIEDEPVNSSSSVNYNEYR